MRLRIRCYPSETNVPKCVVCGQIMVKRDTANFPTYKLVHRPEDA
jgi:hypothetical protein